MDVSWVQCCHRHQVSATARRHWTRSHQKFGIRTTHTRHERLKAAVVGDMVLVVLLLEDEGASHSVNAQVSVVLSHARTVSLPFPFTSGFWLLSVKNWLRMNDRGRQHAPVSHRCAACPRHRVGTHIAWLARDFETRHRGKGHLPERRLFLVLAVAVTTAAPTEFGVYFPYDSIHLPPSPAWWGRLF